MEKMRFICFGIESNGGKYLEQVSHYQLLKEGRTLMHGGG
jgi:hypothetical protein